MTFSRLTSIVQQAGQAASAIVHTPPTIMSLPTLYALITELSSLVGAAIYTLLWWLEYLQRPGRRPEASARRVAGWMFVLATLCGMILAPIARVYAAHRWSDLAGVEGAIVVGGLMGVVGTLVVVKIIKKVLALDLSTPPELPGSPSGPIGSSTSEKPQ